MILTYSGASAFNAVQNNPDLSLGGWMSSSPVPNNLLDNLFSSVSSNAQNNQLAEIKGIFLKNETNADISNLYIYVLQDADSVVSFDFSAVAVSNGQSMEKIPSVRATPYYANFFQANGQSNQQLLTPTLVAGGVIGLWIRRTALLPLTMPEVVDLTNPSDPFNVWYNKLQEKIETPEIVLSWT